MRRSLVRLAIVITLVASAEPAIAWPYRWVDRDGGVTYSDQPPKDPGTEYQAGGVTKRVPQPGEAPAPSRSAPPAVEPSERPAEARPLPEAGPPSRQTPPRERAANTKLLAALRLRREGQRLAQIGHDLAVQAAWRDPIRAAAWVTAAGRLSPERLTRIAETEAGRRVDADAAAVVEGWLVSPAGARVLDALTEPVTPRMMADLRAFVDRLPLAPPPARRITLVRRLVRSIGVGPLAFDGSDLVELRLRAMVTGVRAEPGARRWVSEHERHTLILTALFRCRSLSDAEVSRAVEFWEAPPARTVAAAYRHALTTAVVTVTERPGPR